MLVVAVLIPASALLIQWFTTRQMFLGAMTLFIIGTLVCGIAPQFFVLLIGRVLQAIGTGLMMPVLMNTILVLYPPEERGAAMGSLGLVMMFAPAIGPTLSGLILEVLEWRWLFFLVLPFATFSIMFAFIFLKNVSEPSKPRVDILSILLSTIGFGGIVYGFSSSADLGWGSPIIYGTSLAGIIGLVLFVIRQLRVKEPLLELRVFKHRMFSLTTILLFIMTMTLFSATSLLPFVLQGAFGFTVFATGLLMLPGGLLNGLISPIMGKLFDRVGPRKLIIPGTGIIAIIMWCLTQVTVETSKPTFLMLHICLMVALTMILVPAQTNGLNQLPRQYYPHGTAIMNTLQQVAGAIGVALFISVMASGQRSFLDKSANPNAQIPESIIAGVHNAFLIGFGFAVLAFIVALFTKRSQAPEE